MSYIKFSPINKEKTRGYAVEKMQKTYRIVFVEKQVIDGKEDLVKIATSFMNGKLHSYSSPFLADHVIRTEILPLYKNLTEVKSERI